MTEARQALRHVVSPAANPVLGALLIQRTAEGHRLESGGGLPVVLAFLSIALIMHRPTREAMPANVTATLTNWTQRNPQVRVGLAGRMANWGPIVRGSLLVGDGAGWLQVSPSLVAPGPNRPADPRGAALELAGRARLLGRLLGRAPDADTILTLLGVRVA